VHPFNSYRTVRGHSDARIRMDLADARSGRGDPADRRRRTRGRCIDWHCASRIHRSTCMASSPRARTPWASSFAANHTDEDGRDASIADSLMAPHTEHYSYELCRRHIDRHRDRQRTPRCATPCCTLFNAAEAGSRTGVCAAQPPHCSDRYARPCRASASGCCCAARTPIRRPSPRTSNAPARNSKQASSVRSAHSL
jgi:hypothetical protein